MTPKRDFYEILGISKEADEKQIKDAFRDMAMRYHPDRNKGPGAEERFKEIAEAYAVLSDPTKKRQYDLHGAEGVAGFSQEDLFGGINFDEIFRDFGFSASGFDRGSSVFGKFFGRERSHLSRGPDIEMVVEVPLAKIMSGGSETIEFLASEKCTHCNGYGTAAGTRPVTCSQCQGSGKMVNTQEARNITIRNIENCSKCYGRGFIIERPCSQCFGRGEVENKKRIEISIPLGIEDGMILRKVGLGGKSEIENGSPGDLLLIVRTQKDSRFQRNKANLWYSITIPVYDAVLGVEVDVPALKETITVEVPRGTQAQTTLRLSGKGLPKFNQAGRGDLYVLVNVDIPETLKPKEKKLYEELRSFASPR